MKKIPPALALACFIAAAFFRFALVGYGTLSLCFAGAGAAIVLFLTVTKVFKMMLTAFLCLGVLIFLIAETPVLQAAAGDPDVDADYLIVLGAGVNGSVPSLSMVNRLDAAKAYLDAHPDCVAIVSGGQGAGEDVTEAEAMHRWLTSHGIADDRVIQEPRAANTLENLRFSLALIPDAENARIAVVSSEYHLYRAKLLARMLGYEVAGVPAETTLPVLKLNYFIREAFGVVYYKVFGAG